MRYRPTLPAAAASVVIAALLVACSDAAPACAAVRELPAPAATNRPPSSNRQPAVPQTRQQPIAPKTQQQPQTRTTPQPSRTTTNRLPSTAAPKPTSRATRTQPKVTYRAGRDGKQYRHFDGYPGWYVVGVWPYGYADANGCTVPGQEGDGIDDFDDIFDGD
ncbi:hypothetical protein [Nonomuraea basaltis]|uniref:hypothetical protein n=1 Tax=Nonomuraea basaltis TaxID=2495887 RepID=UPI00110C6B81|nr:hypothetical protein [Nonomuraea basaltis]TMR92403.1 hypothetical protein EJK15_44765 [Nonomuraea basaltis]